MLRFLFFIATGGAISLFILSATGSEKFLPWAAGFTVAAVALLLLSMLGRHLRGSSKSRTAIAEAKQSNQLRAALILRRESTGMYVNEDPQVEFTLLVDRPTAPAFVTTARMLVSQLDMHLIDVGSFLTVAHPDPQYGDVYIADEPVPTSYQKLTLEAGQTAPTLPKKGKQGGSALRVLLYVAALLLGAVGAPYLAVSNPQDYARLLIDGRTDEVSYLDHAVLFDLPVWEETVAKVTDELGHDEVFEIWIRDVSMSAEVPVASGSDATEQIEVQDYEIKGREDSVIGPYDPEADRFRFSDIDWAGVYAGVKPAQELAVERGATNAALQQILVEREDSSGLHEIHVRLFFESDAGSQTVTLDSTGEILPAENFAQLPADEQATYLYDPATLQSSLEEAIAAAPSQDIIDIILMGERFSMDVFADQKAVTIDYREGHVNFVSDPHAATSSSIETFTLDELDTELIVGLIPQAQELMADAGATGTEPTHTIIQRSDGLTISVYVANDAGAGGYVQFDSDGSVVRVSGP